MITIAELITHARSTDVRDREILLAFVLGRPREWLIIHPEAPVHHARAARFRALLMQRQRGTPLAHLLGEQWFFGRPFRVTRDVLIPRPESELLVELAMRSIKNQKYPNAQFPMLDVGTGSGCIAVTLAAELPTARIIAIDASPAALRIARRNAERHRVTNRITFLRGDLLSPLQCPLQNGHTAVCVICSRSNGDDVARGGMVITANLPYLTTAEWRALPKSIRASEPRMAFDGGPDGLAPFRALFHQLRSSLVIGHWSLVILEVDPRRKRALGSLVKKMLPHWEIAWHRDLAGRWRALTLTAPRRD